MSIPPEPAAVTIARAHVAAWSNHDWTAARDSLAPDVKVTIMSTNPDLPSANLTGIDAYMEGLMQFAQAVVPGSLDVVGSVGDERNALLLLTVQAAVGPGGVPVTLPGARLYLFDEHDKITNEQVVFYAATN